ncbi:RidA family protein [Streptomyces sp. NPDC102364]|uniref:RidA family protein n=1 Tax=Streptomyces sp. NPDC102364 TaxID=3366161 RepID=UPI0037F27F4C
MTAKRGLGPLHYGTVQQPWSRGAAAGRWVLTSGIDGVVDETGAPLVGVGAQTVMVLERIRTILADAGCAVDDIVALDQYLADPAERAEYMDVRDRWLAEHGSGLYARRDYASLLIYPRLATPQMRVEIRATACLPEPTHPTHPTPQEGS